MDAAQPAPVEPMGEDPGAAASPAPATPAGDDGTVAPSDTAEGATAVDDDAADDDTAVVGDTDETPLPEVEIADPYGMSDERDCPTCGGVGRIPYGVNQSPRTECCAECGGVGQVLTGSLVSESAMQICEACNGSGYVTKPGAPPPNVAPVDNGDSVVGAPWPGAVWNPQTGSWGTGITAG